MTNRFWQQHSMAILSLLLFFPILLLILYGYNGAQYKKLNLPPSPFKLPIIGNLHQLGSLPHHSLRTLAEKYGPLMLIHFGSIPTLVVSTAEMAQEVLKTHDIDFASRPAFNAGNQLLYSCTDMALSPYGEYWRQVRKICVTELLSPKRVQTIGFIREEEIAIMVKEIKASCSISAVDLTEKFLTLSSSVVSRAALGKKYSEDDKGSSSFAELARDLTILLGAFCVGDLFPGFGWLDVLTGLDGRLKRNNRGLDKFFEQVIKDHRNSKTKDANDKHIDFVDILLRVQREITTGVQLSEDNIKATILDMFVAGTETTSATLEWTMTELITNPRTMVKAQEEVRRVIGRKMKVEEKDIVEMNYLKNVIKETLRLHPPAPLLIPHQSISSVTLQGYFIPPKTRVYINAWAIGRDPKLWEKPNEFLPDRFTNSPIDLKGNDFQLIPFGSGRRICPGMTFASYTMEFALANLLYWFDWEFPAGVTKENLDLSEEIGMASHKKYPLLLVPKYHFSEAV
ncbi:cytochrome P450 71A1-like [Magnolia sinica]|uniref:cytochrome P450 71A1-like n=1 Tax=Magnolia sinica TaxID=86752 RepID=UPI00265A5C0A|nr:cytochrome P450 71A1-like [Magnolia sinica]